MIEPPKIATRFLRWFCREDYLDEIEGDLTEIYYAQLAKSPTKAKLAFVFGVFRYVRPEFIKAFRQSSSQSNSSDMYKNYFKVALRNLLRHRHFTVINVAGLTLGIACALFIHLLVSYEKSYDQYHSKADRIYRVNNGHPDDADTGTPHGLASILRSEFPEMEDVGIIFKLNPEQSNVEINKELFREKNTFLVQPSVFNFLDFQWLQGSPKSLSEPRQAVVAKSIADKYFQGDAVGKVLKLNNGSDFTITGVIADPPVNTDFPIRIAISYITVEKMNEMSNDLDGGTNSYSHTYFSLREGADPLRIDARLKQMVQRHLPPERQKYVTFFIQPLSDIHFNIGNFNQRIISKETLQTLQLIGLVILIVASINFINLASAQAIRRAKEAGIRKTLGSTQLSLIGQFLSETFLVSIASLVFAFFFTSQLLPFSETLFNVPLTIDALAQTETWLFASVVLIGVTLLSGFYPAFVLSRYTPASALKGSGVTGRKGLSFRKSLITFQFLISQVLIVCTIIAWRQTDYFLSKPLGFNKDAVVTFDVPDPKAERLATLRNKLLRHPAINNVSFSLNTPSATINKWWANITHASFAGEERTAEVKFIDSTYLRLFEIPRVAGSIVLPDTTGKSILVNEAFVRELGFTNAEDAVGETITYWGRPGQIIGVVKDFQTVTLRQGIHPVILTCNNYYAKGSVKINMDRSAEALAAIEKYWKEAFDGNYFEFAFLDDQLATFYKDEKKISRLLVTFSSVAVGIGCIGLFGLITFVAAQRAKETSIRKTLGASVMQLATVLSSDFFKLVLVAGVLAWPVSYLLMDRWLQDFSNHIELLKNIWAFLFSLVLALALALITVSFETFRAAKANPVDSLRSQ